MSIIKQAQQHIENNKYEEALQLLQSSLPSENIEHLFILGETYYKLQKWGKAMNAFQDVLKIDQNHKSSQTYLVMIKNIIGFVNLEQLNP